MRNSGRRAETWLRTAERPTAKAEKGDESQGGWGGGGDRTRREVGPHKRQRPQPAAEQGNKVGAVRQGGTNESEKAAKIAKRRLRGTGKAPTGARHGEGKGEGRNSMAGHNGSR